MKSTSSRIFNEEDGSIVNVYHELKNKDIDFILFDYIGYNAGMKNIVKDITKKTCDISSY